MMVARVLCPGCQFGNHTHHVKAVRVPVGVPGGAVCVCEGECQGKPQPHVRQQVDLIRRALRRMTYITNVSALARAMWEDAEEAFRLECEHHHPDSGPYHPVAWEAAHELDRQEYLARAQRVADLYFQHPPPSQVRKLAA